MTDSRAGPFFNLKAVVQQTGVKPDTLRAWERRYGLPEPVRSGGGHRLYDVDDIAVIKWLMARQREGLTIKRAVALWRQIEDEGRNPLKTATPMATEAHSTSRLRAPEGTVAELRGRWIQACLAYDEQRAEEILTQAFALYPPDAVAVQVLQRAVSQVGDAWYRGEATVQQEHFCSALAVRRLESLVMASRPEIRPGRILVACPPEEQHVIGLLVLTVLLRRQGWDVLYLGADVPVERLERTLQATRPNLVLMAAQQLHTAATLLQVAHVLQQEGVGLAYGGLVFNLVPDLRRRIPGHFVGERLDLAPQMVERLITAPRPVVEPDPAPPRV